MKKISKLLITALGLFTLSACDLGGLFGGGDEGEADATLYHLTLSANIELTDEQKEQLYPEYAYGEHGEYHSIYDVPDEKEAFLEAGATEEDFAKHGKLQPEGYYPFFDGDPMYIHAPQVEGYIFKGFFYKNEPASSENFVYRYIETDINGGRGYTRWNMEQKDVELEARYEVLTYRVTYGLDVLESGVGDNLPNGSTYNALTDGVVTLKEPVAPQGTTFKRWYCQKIVFDPSINDNTSVLETLTELPRVYDESIIHFTGGGYELTLFAEFEYPKYNISFSFLLNETGDPEPVERDTVVDKILVSGNRTWIDGTQIDLDTNRNGVEVSASSVISMEAKSWLDIFIFAKGNYYPWSYSLNGEGFEHIYENSAFEGAYSISFYSSTPLTEDTTIEITFAVKQ